VISFAGVEDAGDLTIAADRGIVIDRSTIGSPSLPAQPGNSGSTLIIGRDVSIRNGAFLTSGTFGRGNGGMLVIAAADRIKAYSIGIPTLHGDRSRREAAAPWLAGRGGDIADLTEGQMSVELQAGRRPHSTVGHPQASQPG